MPFTASHVAAVLPLVRSPLAPSALVVGSMAPDLPYYVPLPLDRLATHSVPGALGVDALLGAALLVVWHLLLVDAAVAAGPAGVRARLPLARGPRIRGPRDALVVYLSLVVGAVTHVLWDAFTHVHDWGPAHIGWLAEAHGRWPATAGRSTPVVRSARCWSWRGAACGGDGPRSGTRASAMAAPGWSGC